MVKVLGGCDVDLDVGDINLDVHDVDVDGHLVVSVLLLAILLAAGLLCAVLVVRLEQLKKLVRRTQIKILWMDKIKITTLVKPFLMSAGCSG